MTITTLSTRPDPRVRDDGRCAKCGKPRRVTLQARRYAGVQLDADPFCSTICCRAYHGTFPDGEDEESIEKKSRGGRAARNALRTEPSAW